MKEKNNDQAESVLDKSRRIASVEKDMLRALAVNAPQATIMGFRKQIDDILQEEHLGSSGRNLKTKAKT